MSKFKKGDLFVLNARGIERFNGAGDLAVVTLALLKGQPQEIHSVEGERVYTKCGVWFYAHAIKKYNQFDLKTDPWWIATPTPKISEAVQLWLFDKGMKWSNGIVSIVQCTNSKILTNIEYMSTHKVNKHGFMHDSGPINMDWYLDSLEIKLTFQTTVDSVTYPEPTPQETEAQKELKALEAKIAELTEHANKLKGLV